MLQKRSPGHCLSDDAACVLSQLVENAVITVRKSSQFHPIGSTHVAEEMTEAELYEPWVVIPLETDTIPVDIEGNSCCAGVEFRLRFFHPQVRDGKVTYDTELVPIR